MWLLIKRDLVSITDNGSIFPTGIQKNQIEKIKDFKEGLEQYLKILKIKIDGIQTSETVYEHKPKVVCKKKRKL
jgi:hypothetical protein